MYMLIYMCSVRIFYLDTSFENNILHGVIFMAYLCMYIVMIEDSPGDS